MCVIHRATLDSFKARLRPWVILYSLCLTAIREAGPPCLPCILTSFAFFRSTLRDFDRSRECAYRRA